MNPDDTMRLIYLGLLLVAVAGWVAVEYRNRLGQALRTLLAWGLIFLGAAAGYGLWGDIRRDVLPQQMLTRQGEVVIPRAQDGHYYPRLSVNGRDIVFMADTGASNVVLSQSDARALGIDTAQLAYIGTAITANGPVQTAMVTLGPVTFGPFTDDSLTAYVNNADMAGSLLGMDYLGRFHIEIADDKMILRR